MSAVICITNERMEAFGAVKAVHESILYNAGAKPTPVKTAVWHIPGLGTVKSMSTEAFIVPSDAWGKPMLMLKPWLTERGISVKMVA